MALFTDSNVITLDDLLQFEASLVQTASSHGVNVDTKIKLAVDAIGDKLMLWLLKVGASDPQFLNRSQIGLSTVVVTSTLYKWLCFDSLSRFFAEVYNVQLNTRFQGKWTEYQQEAHKAIDLAYMSGIGIVYNPLARPAMPLVSVQTGTAPIQSIFVQTAWVDRRGNESALSLTNGLILDGATTVVVGMADGAVNVPPAAMGWNIYASTNDKHLTRQNMSPLPIGSTWELATSGLVDGPEPIDGQKPDYFVQLSKQIQRG